MARSLVIVESPAKAKTINKYLGRNYSVKASYGHVMDLPKKTLGILLPGQEAGNGKAKGKRKGKGKAKAGEDGTEKKAAKPVLVTAENEFDPTYEVIPGKIKIIGELRKAAEDAENVYLATDPDREGEAISAHLLEALARKKSDRGKFHRVMFNEITQKAIKAAFDQPGQVNENLVDAQQARRVLDRLVGYKISPLLWDKVRRGLSAGRVQTVALRLIVEREQEIRAFVPKEYWTIHALLAAGEPPAFEAKLAKYKGEDIEIPNEAEAQRILAAVERATWQVSSVTQKEKRRFAPPPFTTSKLQQAGYNRLRYTAKRTMMLAQRLYEGVELGAEGAVALITYMRTDSVRVSGDALTQVREHIGASYGEKYLPEKPNFYKSKKDAQEAHEAIRPTDVARTPESVKPYLEDDMFKLYQMIWQRFVASQMVPAVFDQTTIDVAANDYTFRASGSVMKFDGYLAAYQAVQEEEEKDEEGDAEGRTLPRVTEGERLQLEKIRPEQHFTEPPPRYTEATLVKELEEKGIGRPSTYATIISTIVEREYVNKDQGRFTPTLLGEKVSVLLVKSFEDIFDVGFTARLEEELDEIEEGKLPWKKSVKEFWDRFEEDLDKAAGEMQSYKAGIPTGQKCEKCGQGELLERISRHGFFLGCSRYPECDYIRDMAEAGSEEVESETTTEYCDNCGKEMIIKRGRFGPFLACSGYPECKTTRRLVSGTKKARQPDVPLDEKCPTCGEQLLRRHGRFGEFIGCSAYPKCKYTRPITLGIKCPKCGEGEFVRRGSAKGRGRGRIFYGCSRYPDCDFTTPHEPIAEPCPKCGAPFIVEKHTKQGNFRACLKENCDWEIPAPEALPPDAVAAPVGATELTKT
ncbi:MAG TPA: type I DNA topoisomerase [Candidatus Acidoferrales bacterium]|jgi:DNA topoisomerase-1|nr:type I DNA topoisomerase [Candidatus Acidoferrales bacterium]